MDNSFVVIEQTPKQTNTQYLRRKEIINSICNGVERGHLTEYPHIIKLCRVCVTDVCKTLVHLINWETTQYKKYKETLETLDTDSSLIEELKINITNSKYQYDKYTSLYQKIKKLKLYTKGCYICEEIYCS